MNPAFASFLSRRSFQWVSSYIPCKQRSLRSSKAPVITNLTGRIKCYSYRRNKNYETVNNVFDLIITFS